MAPTAIPVENSYHPRFTARLKTAGIIAHETHVVDRLRDGTVRRVVPVAAVSGYRVTSRAARDNQDRLRFSKFLLYRSLFDLDSAKFPGTGFISRKSTINIGSNWSRDSAQYAKACLSNWRHARGSAYGNIVSIPGRRDAWACPLADDVSDLIDEGDCKLFALGLTKIQLMNNLKGWWHLGLGPQRQGWSRDTAEVTPPACRRQAFAGTPAEA